jgi:prepilin-type N-terminal cleavage/methylation domain-containing protein
MAIGYGVCRSKCRAPSVRLGAQRGFTLVELGVTIVVMVVLMAVMLSAARGRMEAAKFQRTAAELRSLLDAAQTYWDRSAVLSLNPLNCPPGGDCAATSFDVSIFRLPAGRWKTLDLSNTSDRQLAQDYYGIILPPLPQSQAPVPGLGTFDGLSVYGTSYQMTLYSRRVAIAVCVPQDGAAGFAQAVPSLRTSCVEDDTQCTGGQGCAAGYCCLVAESTRPAGRMPSLLMTKKYLNWGAQGTP